MAASSAQPARSDAKAPKKKAAAKIVGRTASPAPTASSAPEKEVVEGQEDEHQESAYIRELQKNIRNVNKKIVNASKTDALLKEHPGKSLDELVAARILNNDQKAQILKKPALQSQLAQLEEQVAQYKKVDADYRARLEAEKEKLEKDLVERLKKEKADAVREVKDKADADAKRAVHDNFLVLSQFLRLAAARRAEEADPALDENAALEGVLLAVYGGDELAVGTMLKLVEGSEETTVGTGGEQLETTFAQIKSVAHAYLSPYDAVEGAEAVPAEPEVEAETEVKPAEEAAPAEQVNGNVSEASAKVNGVAPAEEQATQPSSQSATPPPPETEAAPAPAPVADQSWADDQPETTTEAPAAASADPNDGFHQVQRNRGREREANWRGRGRGEWRGRGGRGDGRGRRGNRGGIGRGGARRSDES